MTPRASSRIFTRRLLGACLGVGLVSLLLACAGDYPQSALRPTSDFATEIDVLYRTIFWWAVGVFVVVQSVLLITLVRFRDRPGAPAPARLHGSTAMEIAWTLAPAVVLVFIAVPTIQTIFRTEAPAPADALTVQVTGHQWWWEFRYPDLGVVTATEVHVPLGSPVALEMTSADVIHSFWVPRMGGKRDVMPGRTTHLTFTPDSVGEFFGQCAEYCGDSHANMRMRVIVDDSARFAAWVADQRAGPVPADSLGDLARQGAQVFAQVRQPVNHSCILCHTIRGVSGGTIGPNLTHIGSRTRIAGGILPATDAGLRRWLSDPPAEKPGSLMPKIELTDQEIAALVAYLRALR